MNALVKHSIKNPAFIPHPSSLIPHPSSLIPHPSSLIPHPSYRRSDPLGIGQRLLPTLHRPLHSRSGPSKSTALPPETSIVKLVDSSSRWRSWETRSSVPS